jgi:hypothetical protein
MSKVSSIVTDGNLLFLIYFILYFNHLFVSPLDMCEEDYSLKIQVPYGLYYYYFVVDSEVVLDTSKVNYFSSFISVYRFLGLCFMFLCFYVFSFIPFSKR